MAAAAILPLEKRLIPVNNKNGTLKEAPAVHKLWIESRTWTRYETPPDAEEFNLPGAVDSWLATSRGISSQLSWLLRLPCNVFWSQLCHDENLSRWLADLMETFPREHDRQSWWTENVKEAHKTILQKLFLVHVRLCTYKESNKDFFSPEYWGELLYEKCLLGLPRILDMCVLFFPCNKSITAKMVGNVLKQQPLFYNDLVECSLTMLAALDSCQEQFQLLSMSQPHMTELASFLEMISYCLDISVSLHSLVSAYPPACDVLQQTGLDVKLGNFYSQVLMALTSLIQKYNSAGCLTQAETDCQHSRVRLARHNILATIRAQVCQLCLLETIDIADRVETFLTFMTNLLSDISLLTDYNNLYPIRAEFELFEAQQAEVDVVRKHYILDMFNSTQTHTNSFMLASGAGAGGGEGGRGEKQKNHDESRPQSEEMMGACAVSNQPSSVELVSLVSGVRDLLPHLGEGFVERVLVEFNYKVDLAINALLEDSLPSHLRSLDQAMPRQVEKAPSPPPDIRSVYDEDEFDVFSRTDVDMSRIHRGKKKIAKDANKLLEDKADLVGMKDRFDRLGIVEDIEIVARPSAEAYHGNEYEYDDEYDDTYDDIAVGEQEPDAQDEHGRGFVLPVALGGGKMTNTRAPVEESEEEEEDEASDVKSKMNFVRNPEEVRQEKERKRQEKISKNRSHNTPPNRDVVGKAKGQGQDKQVLINRARKNANKGKGHRNAADRKAAKGMF